MNELQWLYTGFLQSLTAPNLLACALGVVVGQLVGVLPGLGPPGAMAIALPLMYGRDPTQMLIMLFGVYYGAMYGGTITSILLNAPGEAASVMTCIDGYQMARQGRAGPALGIAAFGSFIAGLMGMFALTLMAGWLSTLALAVQSTEYTAILIFALGMVGMLGSQSRVKALLSALMGLGLATVGIDPTTGIPRYTLGIPSLLSGVDFIPAAMGLFGMAEVLTNLGIKQGHVFVKLGSWRSLLPSRSDWVRAIPSVLRGGIIGFFVGILPGAGATLGSFFAYAVERRFTRYRAEFGHGAIEGVAAPEAANNGAIAGALVPILSLGIPSSASTAIILSGLLIVGITPGPRLIVEYPDIMWPAVASMVVGNVMLLILNVPLVGLSVQVLRLPYPLLAATIVLVSTVGVYSLGQDPFSVWILVFFTAVGYLMNKTQMPAAPLLLGIIVGGLLERNLRRVLTLYGTPVVLLTHPISAVFIAATVVAFVGPPIFQFARKRSLTRGKEPKTQS